METLSFYITEQLNKQKKIKSLFDKIKKNRKKVDPEIYNKLKKEKILESYLIESEEESEKRINNYFYSDFTEWVDYTFSDDWMYDCTGSLVPNYKAGKKKLDKYIKNAEKVFLEEDWILFLSEFDYFTDKHGYGIYKTAQKTPIVDINKLKKIIEVVSKKYSEKLVKYYEDGYDEDDE